MEAGPRRRGRDLRVKMETATISLTDLYAPIREDLDRAKHIFDEELRSEFPFVNELCDTIRSYRGKMLRPALLLLSGRAAGKLTPAHATLAAVVEIVHMATLVHDDVLDEADERRRRPTIRRLAGNTGAVLLGDYLISHAFHLCSGVGRQASRRIGATTNRVCEGELLQNLHAGDLGLGEAQYLDIVRYKTAALTAVSCELGAHFADADESVVSAMHGFGEAAGIAFQIMDDVLDITGEAEVVGKTLGRDMAGGKLTLPTVHALAAVPASRRREVVEVLTAGCGPDRGRLRAVLDDLGSIEYALGVAGSFVAEARRRLDVLPPSEARSSLSAMADFIVRRTF